MRGEIGAVMSDLELSRSGLGPDFFTGVGARTEEPVSAAKADWIAPAPLLLGIGEVSETVEDGDRVGDVVDKVLSLAGRKKEGRGGGEYKSSLLVDATISLSGACVGRDPCLDLASKTTE